MSRCVCGAPEPCVAPRFGGQHVPPEAWTGFELAASVDQLTMDELEELLRAGNEEIARRQEAPR